jgi:DNA-binding MarR family transcriptional regulator
MSSQTDRLNRLMRDFSAENVLLHQAIAEGLGLNATDHKCLAFLLDAGEPITAGALAELTGLTTGAVTGIIDRLEKAGFVRRQREENDRRRVLIELDLRKVRREVFPIFDKLSRRMNALAATYSKRDLAIIMDFMERSVTLSRKYRAEVQRQAGAPIPDRSS